MHGPVALDLNIFQHELTRKKLSESEFDRMIEQLAIIEGEALKWINRK